MVEPQSESISNLADLIDIKETEMGSVENSAVGVDAISQVTEGPVLDTDISQTVETDQSTELSTDVSLQLLDCKGLCM